MASPPNPEHPTRSADSRSEGDHGSGPAGAADQRTEALGIAFEHGLPFTGLRDFTPDSRLFSYLPQALAVRESVLPMLLVGDTLKVAAATPNPDLSLLRERFPYVAVDIVIAPRGEIDLVLAHFSTEI